jgi:hypothetical protein
LTHRDVRAYFDFDYVLACQHAAARQPCRPHPGLPPICMHTQAAVRRATRPVNPQMTPWLSFLAGTALGVSGTALGVSQAPVVSSSSGSSGSSGSSAAGESASQLSLQQVRECVCGPRLVPCLRVRLCLRLCL